ncbi:MAG: hypothetical protein WDA59_02790 [Methanofastidiosum sp.]|jgi:hypothetical protein
MDGESSHIRRLINMYEITGKLITLIIATIFLATIHTAAPDHWMPFVVMGKSREWTLFKTILIAGIAGIGHVGTSVVITLVGIFIGGEISDKFGFWAENITSYGLILFGLIFTFYALYRIKVKKHHSHFGIHVEEHEHGGHKHVHTENIIVYTPAILIGLTPCVALLPLALATQPMGLTSAIIVVIIFALFTIGTMMTLTIFAYRGLSYLNLNVFEKYGDVIAGVIITLTGVLVKSIGI